MTGDFGNMSNNIAVMVRFWTFLAFQPQKAFALFASLRDMHGCISAAMTGRHRAALCVEIF
jgi:hypothetical protein